MLQETIENCKVTLDIKVNALFRAKILKSLFNNPIHIFYDLSINELSYKFKCKYPEKVDDISQFYLLSTRFKNAKTISLITINSEKNVVGFLIDSKYFYPLNPNSSIDNLKSYHEVLIKQYKTEQEIFSLPATYNPNYFNPIYPIYRFFINLILLLIFSGLTLLYESVLTQSILGVALLIFFVTYLLLYLNFSIKEYLWSKKHNDPQDLRYQSANYYWDTIRFYKGDKFSSVLKSGFLYNDLDSYEQGYTSFVDFNFINIEQINYQQS